ncbi:MAG: tRNA pseudouridine(55) synthase TruB [Acidobacteriota bacterium]|nr:tRNA pseudouridine(55) synthase TruB [Acidobacteriota bacterium]
MDGVLSGVLVVDKPEGWTSHDVVNKMRGIAGTRRVGHLGTLDPIATGVLPLVVGQATRLAQFYTRSAKTYEAVVRFGFATDTYDRAGVATTEIVEPHIDAAELEAALAKSRGKHLQAPPPVSAKKVGGVPAYKLARRNIDPELALVEVEIEELAVLKIEGPMASLLIRCSAGTYIRAIAHEAGLALRCGAHVHALRRTVAGNFTIAQARGIAEFQEKGAAESLISMAEMLPEIPSVIVDALTAVQIRNGRDFHASPFRAQPFRAQPGTRHVRAVSEGGDLIAIGEAKLPNIYHPIVVL